MSFESFMEAIGFVSKYKYDSFVAANVSLNALLLSERNKNEEMLLLLESTKKQDAIALAELKAKLEPDPMQMFWESRYPETKQCYERIEKSGSYQIDVRDFFMIKDINIPRITGKTDDEKALAGLCFVIDNIKYVSDKTSYGYDEYWAFWYETWARKIGDCEDGAILLANILLANGVTPWRVRLNAGSVLGGGHAYVTYCRETDNQWVCLDWCYWSSRKSVSERKLHKDEQNYSDPERNFYVWFSWTNEKVFGRMDTMLGMPEYFKAV